jgi:sarcosine oxidase subunit beta
VKNNYDAVIIGAGIIGGCIALELCKQGLKTINIDFQTNAGAGSTTNSCGNVRFHYSTVAGAAMAYESAWYWHNWKALHMHAENKPNFPICD